MIRARDLPELRAKSVHESERVTAQIAAETNQELADGQRRLRDAMYGPPDLLRFWELADLFYVSDEMSELAGQAVTSMPGFNIHPEDLPSEFGLICLQSADLSEGSHVISVWGPDYHSSGVSFASYGVKPDDILLLHRTSIPYGQDEIAGSEGAQQWARVVRCCWLLMQQRIATVTEEKPDRASARRIARAGRPAEPVRVISLRRPASTGDGHSDREFVHRWVVRGHWRKQWYSSQDRHVPIWISPHVKGPEGAPLLGGEKVYAWTR